MANESQRPDNCNPPGRSASAVSPPHIAGCCVPLCCSLNSDPFSNRSSIMSSLRRVPPAPHVMSALYMDYVRDGKPYGTTFRQYLRAVGYADPAANIDGMDDGA